MQERPLEPVRKVEHRVVDHRDYEECGGREEETPDNEDEQTRIVSEPHTLVSAALREKRQRPVSVPMLLLPRRSSADTQ
jgi:hypothetical protein